MFGGCFQWQPLLSLSYTCGRCVTIASNSKSNELEINEQIRDKEIRLIGHGQKYAMVRKALQRNGIRADRHVESPVWIETGDLSVGSAFLIHHLDGRTLAADTIESLLQELSV